MNSPQVAVILTTYNRATILSKAILSVFAQSYRNWELLVVDDGSTDGTGSVISAYIGDKVKYIRHEINKGVSAARNTGLRNCSQRKYVAFIDDDDAWLPQKLEKQVALLERHPSLGAVGCGRIDVSDNENEIVLPEHRGWVFEQLLGRTAKGYSGPLLVINRQLAPAVFFDESLICLEDNDFAMAIARNHQFDFVPEPLVIVSRKDETGSHLWNHQNALTGYKSILKKYRDYLVSNPKTEAFYIFSIARELAYIGEMGEARNWLHKMISLNQEYFRGIMWMVGTFIPKIGVRACNRYFSITPPK